MVRPRSKVPAFPAPLEHIEQTNFFIWCGSQANAHRIPEAVLFYAIPNGGDRHPAVASRLKAEGVKPGVPDVENPAPRLGFTGIHIEFKKRWKYEVKPEQWAWLEALRAQGRLAIVARGWEEAAHWFEFYMGRRAWPAALADIEPKDGKQAPAKEYLTRNPWGDPKGIVG